MNALLANLKPVGKPVVLAGELNTTSRDNTPTSIRNEIMSRVTDYRFWINQAVSKFHPLGIFQYALVPLHYWHGYGDPTAIHFPILWENRERALFKTAESFSLPGWAGVRFPWRRGTNRARSPRHFSE